MDTINTSGNDPVVINQDEGEHRWHAIVYDCDFMSFDEVVKRIQEGTNETLENARFHARVSELRGFSYFYTGSLTECKKACEPLAKIGLRTDIVPEGHEPSNL